jgi:iron complex outermembrane receptor protein
VLSKGAISADNGFGYGSDNGMVDMCIKAPLEDPHITLKQVVGSDSFSRSYIRGDSGNVSDIAEAFVSASYTIGDKWKGEGESPDGRKNCAFGISSTANQKIEWAVYSIYNEDNRHYYKGLSYEQSQDLSRYKDVDYNTSMTGVSSQDINYYDYNRQHFETYTFIGKLKVPLSDQSSIMFKPYYLRDEGYRLYGSRSKIIDWPIEHDTYGAVLEYAHTIEGYEFKLGWWYQEDEPPGPPTARKNRSTNSLTFLGWERLAKGTNHKFSSPYITVKKTFGGTTVNLGAKYLWITQPDFTYYDTTGIGDVDYSTALSMASDVDFKVTGQTHELFLPNIGVTQRITETLLLRGTYGKNYNTPQYSFGGQIINLRNKGMSETLLQKMWSDLEPESSDNFDLGIIFNNGKAFISTTVFYSLVENVGGSFYDPSIKTSYYQNEGEAHSYGLEVGAGYAFTPYFNVGLSLTYNKYEFTDDIEAASGSIIKAEGHQIPDVPEFMANLSASWRIADVVITPTIRYLGQRYVDVENNYIVDPYVVVDLSASRKFEIWDKHFLTLTASATNLFDEEYIAYVSASDISLGRETPTYYVGAPRTFFLALQYDF